MPFPDDAFLAIHRQPDETGEYNEGLSRIRTALWEMVLKPVNYGKETGLLLAATILPKYLDPWVSADGLTTDGQCVARTASVNRDNQKGFLRVRYNYATMAGLLPGSRGQLDPATAGGGGGPGSHGSGSATTPADLAPAIGYGYEDFDEALRKDFTAPVQKWILNKAGRFPQPLPIRKRQILVIRVQRWVQQFPLTLFLNHGHTVNVAAWNGFLARGVYHPPLTCGPRQEFGGQWWRNCELVFKVHPDANGWDTLLASFDTHEKGDNGKPVPILDLNTGQPTSEQWPLDVNGKRILDLAVAPVATELFKTVEQSNFDLLTVDLTGEMV